MAEKPEIEKKEKLEKRSRSLVSGNQTEIQAERHSGL